MPSPTQPRISLNKLSEFIITSNPTRRRKILEQQKFPPDGIPNYYYRLWEPLDALLRSGGTDTSVVTAAIAELQADVRSKWHKTDAANTVAVLKTMVEMAPRLCRPGREFRLYHASAVTEVGAVRVSIAPDFLVFSERDGVRQVGALKLHNTKEPKNHLGENGGKYVASMLYSWLKDHRPEGTEPRRSMCMFVEPWAKTIVAAPASDQMRMHHVEDACFQIAAIWPALNPPMEEAA